MPMRSASKVASVSIIAVCQVAAMALWFSASAIIPALVAEFHLGGFAQAALTSGVQAGFVLGCLVSAFLGLADRIDPRRLFAASAAIGAASNALLLVVDPASAGAPLLRVVTGVCMAGVYPVGMKLASTWAKGDMGLMVGILVGALTLGSASPHLFNALGGVNWRIPLALASASAMVAAVLILFAGVGPNRAPSPRFDPADRGDGLARRSAAARQPRLPRAHVGALRHVGVDRRVPRRELRADAAGRRRRPGAAKLAAFATIAAGAIGSVGAGLLADRLGRTTITIVAMAVSGSCAATVGLLFGGNPVLLVALCLVWGVSIVADSAQFSASIAELSDRAWVGTMLTLQTALGFTLTLVTIHLMPYLIAALGWQHAFVPLAIGPAFGVYAMVRLRAHPRSVALAGGRR